MVYLLGGRMRECDQNKLNFMFKKKGSEHIFVM